MVLQVLPVIQQKMNFDPGGAAEELVALSGSVVVGFVVGSGVLFAGWLMVRLFWRCWAGGDLVGSSECRDPLALEAQAAVDAGGDAPADTNDYSNMRGDDPDDVWLKMSNS